LADAENTDHNPHCRKHPKVFATQCREAAVSHQWMLQHVLTDKVVLQKWLQAGYIENRTLFPTEAGTPQGGIISPTLANLTLDGLEKLLAKHFPRQKWKNGKIWSPKD
jgi:RNA-directed DNA polymerase